MKDSTRIVLDLKHAVQQNVKLPFPQHVLPERQWHESDQKSDKGHGQKACITWTVIYTLIIQLHLGCSQLH